MSTGFVTSVEFLKHVTHPGHPERVARLESVHKMMRDSGLESRITAIQPRPAELEDIERIHSRGYIDRLKQACERGERSIDCADSSICPDTYRVALLAAGAARAAVDAVIAGTVRNAFCAVRPPGHHAERDESMGFCMFNNIAVAARYAQVRHGAGKVLIFDWDVHHGNGTQHSFEDDDTVFFCSFHQHPRTLYPGTGFADERGKGRGEGFNLNVPFAPGAGDDQYRRAFDEVFLPAARKFAPDLVLVSAGFDAHAADPLAQIELSERGFSHMATGVVDLARTCCGGRLVALLEGGYDLTALAQNVKGTIEEMMKG